jgi:AhpD family alkylhydroperoxidase
MNNDFSKIYEQTKDSIGRYGQANPKMMAAFSKVHHEGAKDGALTSKWKELIALGISIHAKCEGCISMHVNDAIHLGANREEIVETIGTAIYMGGGPSVVHGAKALEAFDQFEGKSSKQTSHSIINNN